MNKLNIITNKETGNLILKIIKVKLNNKISIIGKNKQEKKVNKLNSDNIILTKSRIDDCIYYKNEIINSRKFYKNINNNFELLLKYKDKKYCKKKFLKNPFI